jgi:hypothetical protein
MDKINSVKKKPAPPLCAGGHGPATCSSTRVKDKQRENYLENIPLAL